MMNEAKDPVREFLDSYWEMRKESARLERRIEELSAQTERVTAQLTGMPRGGGDGANLVWDALIDTKDRAGKNLKAVLDREAEIEEFILMMDGPLLRQLLRYKYLELLTYEQIAAEMNYSERHVRRLHGRALQEARRTWELVREEVRKEAM